VVFNRIADVCMQFRTRLYFFLHRLERGRRDPNGRVPGDRRNGGGISRSTQKMGISVNRILLWIEPRSLT